MVQRVADEVIKERANELPIMVGTMIEIPRARADRDEIGEVGRVLHLRHERPDADDVRLLARRRGRVPARYVEKEILPRIRSSRSTGRRRPAGATGDGSGRSTEPS